MLCVECVRALMAPEASDKELKRSHAKQPEPYDLSGRFVSPVSGGVLRIEGIKFRPVCGSSQAQDRT